MIKFEHTSYSRQWLQRCGLSLMLLVILSTFAQAQSGNYNGFNYQLGPTPDGGFVTITGYTGPGGAIVTPSIIGGMEVTDIGPSAFLNLTGITSVSISNNTITIAQSAFQGCTGLTSLTIPNGVKTIGASAFASCSNLFSLTIGFSITSIDRMLLRIAPAWSAPILHPVQF